MATSRRTTKRHGLALAALATACALLACLASCGHGTSAVAIDTGERSAAAKREPAQSDGEEVVFGFDKRLEVKEDVKMYVPLLEYLERETGYRFKIHVTSDEAKVVDELGDGEVDMAAIGTLGYLQADEKYGASITVRGLNEAGSDTYRAAIVVPADSPVESISELSGGSFAFGDNASTQGNLIPLSMLSEGGVALGSLSYYQHFSSHSEVANAVIRGDFDAGGIQDTLAYYLEEKGLIRILSVSEDYPSSGIVFSPSLEQEKIDRITDALLRFDPKGKDSEGLYRWDMSEMPSGFVPADPEDYDELRLRALDLGLLPSPSGAGE